MSSTSDSQFGLEPISSDALPGVPNDLPMMDLSSSGPIPFLSNSAAETEAVSAGQPGNIEPEKIEPEVRTPKSVAPVQRTGFWLDGNAVFAACPDCGAPISIRLWLMLADCWHCGACIELTEEQERQVRELLERQKREQAAAPSSAPSTPAAPSSSTATPSTPAAKERPRARQERPVESTPPKATPLVRRPSRAPTGPAAEMQRRSPVPRQRKIRVSRRTTAEQARAQQQLADFHGARRSSRLLNSVPAWLISLLVHLILLLLLAIWQRPVEDNGPEIVLSLRIGPERQEGGEVGDVDPTARLAFDLPLPEGVDENDPDMKDEIMHDREDAGELLMDPNTHAPDMPKVSEVRKMMGSSSPKRAIAARDPRIRAEVLRKEGGTTKTEAAVARGLRWLAAQQEDDGRWRLSRPGDPYSSPMRSDAGATSLALLPFLGAGQTHQVGKYKDTVGRGLQWLINHQTSSGFLGKDSDRTSQMYAHGQATIVLCEAFTMTGDERLRKPAQRAVDFIINAQHDGGGWRYGIRERGDTSVLGWQVMALKSAQTAGLRVPSDTLQGASRFLDKVGYLNGSLYAYTESTLAAYARRLKNRDDGIPASASMTAEGLLCRIYLGWKPTRSEVRRGLRLLQENFPIGPSTAIEDLPHATFEQYNMYYVYYATQAYKQHGGNLWHTWNRDMRRLLVNTQISEGPDAGSWIPTRGEAHDRKGGRLYMTSLAVCCLEVYYRYLPIFQADK